MSRKQLALFEPTLVVQALKEAVKKLNPQAQWRNPVMFIVWIGSLLTTCISIAMASGAMPGNALFSAAISGWLWITVLFANFAEALAEGRSKAQANSLKGVKKTAFARKLREPKYGAAADKVPADQLRKGDIVLVEAGDIIPCDGEVIEGGASVDESAITGESAPVIRESGGDFASVTGGTRILSDWLVIECSVNPGETFLDRMIAMVEGAQRRKTPNEIALTILLIALTIVFLLATATLWPFSAWGGNAVSVTVLVALLVCLIPTTIGGLLSAIGVAGMSRMLGANVIATSGRAVEAAGDVDVLLLDKTGTITLGNRQASEFIPAQGVDEKTLADAAQLASLADETPEGRSIVILAKQRFNLRERDVQSLHATFVPFTAQSRMSGINIDNRMIRKGSVDAIRRHVEANGGHFPTDVDQKVDQVARQGATPLVRLNRIGNGRILAKVESRNPSFSVKCRIGANMIWDAEKRGVLKPGVELVEPTSGNTGIALAYVAAARGYKLTLTMPETMSIERRKLLKALGANLVLTEGAKGMKGAIQKAEEIVASNPEKYLLLQQFSNPANPEIHEKTTGPEIWEDTDGQVDVFIAGVGTGGTLTGVSRYIKGTKGKTDLISVAVEPTDSPVIAQALAGEEIKPGPHKIQGIGAGFIPANLDLKLVDKVIGITNEEAISTARRLMEEEGILAGISSGAAVAAALKLQEDESFTNKNIVVILPSSGERYLSTALFADLFTEKELQQ